MRSSGRENWLTLRRACTSRFASSSCFSEIDFTFVSSSLKHRGAPLDEGLNALAGVGAVQHAFAHGRNMGDRRRLTLLDIFRGSLLGHLNAERRIFGNDRGERHRAFDLLARR